MVDRRCLDKGVAKETFYVTTPAVILPRQSGLDQFTNPIQNELNLK